MTKRQFPPRIEQQRAGVQARQAFPGSVSGTVRNAYPIHKADRLAVRVPTGTTISAETFWVEDHFTVSSTTPGTFTLSYVPRTNSEDITVNGVTLLPATEWTRSGVTLTVDAGVWLGLNPSYPWDLLVQYEVAAAAPTVAPLGYSLAVIDSAPIAYYRLGEASGTVMVDSSGFGRDGTYTTPPTLGVAGLVTGSSDTAASFNGSSQYASAAVAGASWVSPATPSAEAIIKLSSTGAAAGILTHFYFSSGSYGLYVTAGAKAQMVVYVSGVGYSATGSTTLSAGTKYHVAGTYDGTTIRIYVNGVLDGSAAVSGSADSHTGYAILVGANDVFSPAQFFPGVLDEVALYDHALSASDVAAHAAAV